MPPPPPRSTLFPYTTLFRSALLLALAQQHPPDRLLVHPKTILRGRLHRGPRSSYRSEEHTSELQSRFDLVCRLLLEKKKYTLIESHTLRMNTANSRSWRVRI